MKQVFNTGFERLGTVYHGPSEGQIREIPQLYRADMEFAYKFGGPYIQKFLKDFKPLRFEHISIDVKVHMLQPGWFPCIPGWHLDDFWRPNGGQPDLNTLHEHPSVHTMVVWGDAALPEFLEGPVELPQASELVTPGQNLYAAYNLAIEAAKLPRKAVQPGVKYKFTHLDFHRGVAATKPGWRCFVRITESDHREPKNEIRSQSQVYIPTSDLYKGW